jgi:hypothetical protein
MTELSLLNSLKVFQLKDIIKQHLIKNPEIKLKTSVYKLNKIGLIGVIKSKKINLDDYPDYPKSSPGSKANTNILKKYGKEQYNEDQQKQFLINEEENKNMALIARKVKRNAGKEPLTLQKHQVAFIKQFIYSNLNGAVMFHGVGSGKTLTAVVCAYWYLKLYPNNRVICISPSALLFNFIEGMRQFGVPIKDNRYTFTTYEKYARMSKEKKNAKDCLLIVDEAHNLRTEIKIDVITDPNDPTKITGKEGRTNKRGFNVLEYGAMNADKILLLTGTAFVNSIYDIENLIAMVDKRDPILKNTFFNNVISSPSNITDYFSYRISYVPSSKSDMFPERREKLKFFKMSKDMSSEYNSFKEKDKNKYVEAPPEKIKGGYLPPNLKIAKAVIMGRNDYPPKVRNILKKYGNEIIVSYKLKRTPVSSLITSALSAVSMGEFGKRLKNSDYDQLFHLFLEMTTQIGKRISVEKNATIHMEVSPPTRANEDVEDIINNIPTGLTINTLMNNTQKKMGNKFQVYNSKSNNCQDFILSILQSNNIGDESDFEFVKQDTDFLFENLPILQRIANATTDLGATVNVLTEGTGTISKKKPKKRVLKK